MRPGMRWKYNLRVGGGGAGVGMRCFPVWCSLFHFSDIFSSSMWTESSDCPGGEGGGGVGWGDLKEVWVGMCRRGHQTFTLFKTNIAHFATPLLDRKPYFMKLFI